MKSLNHSRILAVRLLAAGTLLATACRAFADVRYVDVNSDSPTPPYTNWATAARTIQAALDAAVDGDQVLVTNGLYRAGQQVTVTKLISVRSANGAALTVIDGQGAVRCVYLATGAALTGFTLTNGVGFEGGGGVWCESPSTVVSQCVLMGNSSYSDGGGVRGGTLNQCTLTDNRATDNGGGAKGATLNNCVLTHNSAFNGGGVYECSLNNCALTGNSATNAGGGVSGGEVNNCIVYYNSAWNGNNYDGSFLRYSCTTPLPPPLSGVGNISAEPQLADLSHLSAGSPCRGAGSGAYATGLDIDGETWANPPSIGCDEYHPGAVIGPLSVSVQSAYTNVAVGFAVNFAALIGGRANANQWVFGDGTVVSNRPYAMHSWAAAGDYSVVFKAYNDTDPGGVSATITVHVVAQPVHYVALGSASPVAPYTSWVTAANNIQDAVDAASVAGALVLVTNGVYQTGQREAPETMTNRVAVTKSVMVRSVSGPAVTVIDGQGAVRCVYLTNGAALVGFTLTNGVAERGGGVWCGSTSTIVSNCALAGNSASYDGSGASGGGAYGGTLNNCVLTGNSGWGGGGAANSTLNNCTLTGNSAVIGGGVVESTLNNSALNGNAATNIDGNGGGASASTLNNCTLTGNSATLGGGAANSTLNNCTLTANLAIEGGWRAGGGAYESTLNNCNLIANSANAGGGVAGGTLRNCTLSGNSANEGGGAYDGTLLNCIVYYNSAGLSDNYSDYTLVNYSCAIPLPTNGIGNLTNAPLFLDQTGGNLRLQANSPCINAGSNASAPPGSDLDGNPRIAGGTVDMGAYEFQSPRSRISHAWLQQYHLAIDGSADYTDPDGDGANNWQEWRAGTDPTNARSVLRLLGPASDTSGVIVSWQSVDGLNYFLERGTDLGAHPRFLPLATNIVGQPGTTTFTDTNAVGSGPFFYRVGVRQ